LKGTVREWGQIFILDIVKVVPRANRHYLPGQVWHITPVPQKGIFTSVFPGSSLEAVKEKKGKKLLE